jgi:type IV pilus assembly protein PilP
MKKNLNSLLVALPLVLACFGCSKKNEQPQAPAPKPAQVKPAAPAAAVQKQLSSASAGAKQLDFHNRTDPFKPFAPVVAAPQPGAAAPARPAGDLLPIQSYETSKFKVVGIIAGLTENRALILDPNGKGYTVQAGMPIGDSNGRISRITASSVEVVESFKDDKGKTRKRTIVLSLAKKR